MTWNFRSNKQKNTEADLLTDEFYLKMIARATKKNLGEQNKFFWTDLRERIANFSFELGQAKTTETVQLSFVNKKDGDDADHIVEISSNPR